MTRRLTRRLAPTAGLLAAALLLCACREDPGAGLPAGTLWAGDAASARQVLAGLERLGGSPAARAARRLDERLAGCERFLAHCPEGAPCALADQIDCQPSGELLAAADEVRGGAGWVLAHRAGERRFTAWGTPTPGGGVTIRAFLTEPEDAAPEPWQVLLPARKDPAAAVLAPRGALLRLRLRSDRGAAAFAGLTTGDRAAEMYGLRAEAFSRMALEGTTELALYEPARGEHVPPLALAVHVRLRDAAVKAMEALLADLRKQWPVSRTPWSHGGHDGACLSDLNVLPGLAPCYVTTDRALVLGWNQRSVQIALPEAGDAAATPTASGHRDVGSELRLDLASLPAADGRLRASFGAGQGAVQPYPWSGLSATGRKRAGGYELVLTLAGATPAPQPSAGAPR